MKRHELWRHRYRMRRDLDHLSEDELSERLHDCVNNLRTRTERGKLGLLMPNEPAGGKWMELFTEVLEECNLRAYSFPGPIVLDRFRESMDHAFDPIPDMDQALSKLSLGRKPYLLKFGDRRWLQRGLEHGTFRVASASFYDSDDHNHARRDTELERFIRTNPRFGDGAAASSGGTWNSVSSSTDYYLFSLSEQYSSRLFGDFAATACLIIFDPRSFLTRLRRAVSQQLPGWQIQTSRVQYYDPVRIDPRKIVVPTYKPFRHWYQSELRLISSPPEPIANLPALNISIGPLNDCAMLVDLSSHPPPALPADPRDDPIQRFGTTQERTNMVNHLPDAAKVQGIVLNKSAHRHQDWYFQVQYTDSGDNWHEIKIPMLDGLYLLNLLRTAEEEQHLGLWNQ